MRLFLFAVSGTILPAPDDRSKIEAAIAVFRIQCCWYAPRADIVSTIAEWLKSLGLSQYTDCFVENGIDVSVLPDLTDQDLKDLGDLLDHLRKTLRAIRDLGGTSDGATAPAALVATKPRRDEAERRQLTVMFTDLVGSTALSSSIPRSRPLMRWTIAMHFRDDTDRDGKQNKDIDGCAADKVVEVDGVYEYPLVPTSAAAS